MSESKSAEGRGVLPLPAQQRLNQMLIGQFLARAIALAADLRIADLLRDGPLSIDELAERTGSHPDALYRVMRAMAAADVFDEQPGRRFSNNEVSTYLRHDVDGSLATIASWLSDISGWTAWGRLDYSVRTGKPAFDEVFGVDCFGWLNEHPRSLRVFQDAMSGYSAVTTRAVIEAYDFSGITTLLDVGGGHGTLLAGIASRWPGLSGILFDRAEVIAEARAQLGSTEVGRRIQLVAGNFLEGVPVGADAIILKHIVHDWDDEHCALLLGHCRKNLSRGNKLLIVESILADREGDAFPKFLDLEMLVMMPGGRERTGDEFAKLLARSGFDLTRVIPTRSPVVVIEAVASSAR